MSVASLWSWIGALLIVNVGVAPKSILGVPSLVPMSLSTLLLVMLAQFIRPRVLQFRILRPQPSALDACCKQWRRAKPSALDACPKQWRRAQPSALDACRKQWRRAHPSTLISAAHNGGGDLSPALSMLAACNGGELSPALSMLAASNGGERETPSIGPVGQVIVCVAVWLVNSAQRDR